MVKDPLEECSATYLIVGPTLAELEEGRIYRRSSHHRPRSGSRLQLSCCVSRQRRIESGGA